MPRLLVALALLLVTNTDSARALEVSRATPATVVVAQDATLAEQTAAQEVADYLGRITGATISVVAETTSPPLGIRIFVGPTRAAARLGLNPALLGPEEWIVRTAGRNLSPVPRRPGRNASRVVRTAATDLYLVGGRPRGTLYAAYHFLEDVVGVRWWNPWEETVPATRFVRLGSLNLHGKPAFVYRHLWQLYSNDDGRFAARSRINCDGDTLSSSLYGGSLDYGPPYHVHTAFMYFPPDQYFAQHPEWYSFLDGQRNWCCGQLCWSNPELRQALLVKLLDNIATSRSAAASAHRPPPQVFSISQNDGGMPCQCEQCQALAKAQESEAAPLLDCVNFLADAVRERYPDVLIDTLCYIYGTTPPKTLQPRDNVVLRFCGPHADMLTAVSAPENAAPANSLLTWARISKHLRIWDYAVTYGPAQGLPLPTSQTFGPDYRFYAAHGIEGVFAEMEDPILTDLRDFKVWCLARTLEDPNADYETLTDTFMNGFYGPAGPNIRQYLRELEAEAARCEAHIGSWLPPLKNFTYLNLDFVNRAQGVFDEAERAVAGDPVLTRRVRHARLPLDRATLLLYPKLLSDWQNQGRDPARFPPDRAVVVQRAKDTWYVQIGLRGGDRAIADAELRAFAVTPSNYDLPERFRDYAPGTVLDYTAIMTRNWNDTVKVVPDPEAESGVTNRLDLTAPDLDQRKLYLLPMIWQLFSYPDGAPVGSSLIRTEDVPGPGYNWYKMGTFALAPTYCVNFFWSGILQLDTCDYAFDPAHPEQKFEFWARVKFEGPGFPYAEAGDTSAISVERVVLVRTE